MKLYNKGLRSIATTNGEKDEKGSPILIHILPQKDAEVEDKTAEKLLKMYPHDLIQFADLKQTADLSSQIEELEAQISQLKTKNEELEAEKETLNSQISHLKTKNEVLIKKLKPNK